MKGNHNRTVQWSQKWNVRWRVYVRNGEPIHGIYDFQMYKEFLKLF